METAADGSTIMNDSRKTVQVKILAGYVPTATKPKQSYIAAVFAAFWSLAK